MKLYTHPTTPRPNAFYLDVPTPASAYRLQQQLLRAYREVLFQWWDLDLAITTCFGPKQGKRLQAAEDRLQYEVPELLVRMSPNELELAAAVFYHQTLVGFVWHVLAQERTLQHRLEEGNSDTRLNDDCHTIAAGLGKSKPMQREPAQHTAPEPIPVDTTPIPSPPVIALPAPHPPASPQLKRLHLRVNQAQNRRRLKRKRR
ncbi:hypothetical protein [Hymenobacter fodinae]|uniref:Uncharacterized protein n=1 Tax=Hymenobacter fodinae TaxID=2510796 RepID=A0A4Z0P102_9BACT|nr:hypothetical protein [Hymenobacter fodinae]TGE03344.1 hypothetical protein EU556_25855 [Hymenobacter fodinae]